MTLSVLHQPFQTKEQAEAAVGIRKGNTELLASVNKTLERLKSEDKINQMVTEASLLMADKVNKSQNIFNYSGNTKVYMQQVLVIRSCCLL